MLIEDTDTAPTATLEQLYALHRALLTILLAALSGTERPPAAIMDIARRFLKDNGIVIDGSRHAAHAALVALDSGTLPFLPQ